MTVDIAYIVFALLLLFAGAECLVKGSASLALRAGLSSLMVGLTVVAFGTSSPELVVSVKSALSEQGDISVGNVIGSNSFNIGIILGLTALLCPIPVNRQIIKIDAPIAFGVAILLPLLLMDHILGRVEGLLLLAGIVAYMWLCVILGGGKDTTEQSDISVPFVSRHWGIDVAYILGGLAARALRTVPIHTVAKMKSRTRHCTVRRTAARECRRWAAQRDILFARQEGRCCNVAPFRIVIRNSRPQQSEGVNNA